MDKLVLTDLSVRAGQRALLHGVGLTLRAGEILALVGDSGSGKSLTARALLGILPADLTRTSGELEVVLSGTRHRPLQEGFGSVRGGLSYLPQAAARSLDPLWTVERHLRAVSQRGEDLDPWLHRAGFTNPGRIRRLYPHELSGGMAQRVSIALALAQRARFLIADEPTTGLDSPVQRAFLRQLTRLRDEGLGILLITHDLGLLTGLADRILQMRQGRIHTPTPEALAALEELLHLSRPPHPPTDPASQAVSVRVESHRYRRGLLSVGPEVLSGVSLTVRTGEVVGLIGESGSGKTTLARAAAGLLTPTRGSVTLLGTPLTRATPLRPLRRRMQVIFQSAEAHLNPGMTTAAMLMHSARLHRPGEDPVALADAALERVGLKDRAEAMPHHLSGGERRRVGIARVLIARPALLISDEPTTGLDAAKRADLLRLLLSSAQSHLIISHDLRLIAFAADRIAVMLGGRLIESFPAAALGTTHHPYTHLLLGERSSPEARDLQACPLPGSCAHARHESGRLIPGRLDIGPDHWIACHHIGEA